MEKEFDCQQCGHKIIARPPDDIHTIFSIQKSDETCIEIRYECDDCQIGNIRYWCKPSPRFVVSRSFNELN